MSKNEFALKGQMDRTELAKLLENAARGFELGTIRLRKGEECVTLQLSECLEYEIEMEVKKDKRKLSIELKWENEEELIQSDGPMHDCIVKPDAHADASLGLGVAGEQVKELAHAWSIKKGILGKDVYNEAREKVGIVEDLIVTPENAISYAIIGAGGFLGMAKHDVCIPVKQFKIADKHLLLPGATKDAVKAMPPCNYIG
jgi:amphi-Trp domain-containing protein